MTLSINPDNSLCMRGRIYSDKKCPFCNSGYIHDDKRRGLFCPNHPEQQANSRFIVQFGRKIRKRFTEYRLAERYLDGLRYEVDKGTFDYRDHIGSNPLSFITLSDIYLSKKKNRVKQGTYQHIERYIHIAQNYFKNTNVKNIQYAQIEDYIDSLTVSNKTKSNYLSTLHDFYRWILKRKEITRSDFPEFPEIKYELGYRKTVSKESQLKILNELRRISYNVNPKIWLGVKFLTTYISIRPNELRNLKECHIDIDQGLLFIPHPKEKRPKLIPLIQEDIELLKKYPVGLPDLYFFRHNSGIKGCIPGSRFGVNIFYKWWKRSCSNLGITGVDLYGGTRHTSAMALREFATPEEIKRATMHTTNKAFERYYQVSKEELQSIYDKTRICDTGVIPIRKSRKKVTS